AAPARSPKKKSQSAFLASSIAKMPAARPHTHRQAIHRSGIPLPRFSPVASSAASASGLAQSAAAHKLTPKQSPLPEFAYSSPPAHVPPANSQLTPAPQLRQSARLRIPQRAGWQKGTASYTRNRLSW